MAGVPDWQKVSDDLKAIQRELAQVQRTGQQLLRQKQESEMVLKELGLCPDDAKVHKLIGPLLQAISKEEAIETINKRIEFMEQKLKETEKESQSKQKKQQELQEKVMKIQMQLRAMQEKNNQKQQQQGGALTEQQKAEALAAAKNAAKKQ